MISELVWVVLFLLEPIFIFAANEPSPSGAPPDFAPPAGPPPPPPLPIDDYVLPMFFVGILIVALYLTKDRRFRCS